MAIDRISLVLVLGVIFSLSPLRLWSQSEIRIEGQVADALSKIPIPYASLALVDSVDGRVKDGVTTGEDGTFDLTTKETDFYLEISFMGYQSLQIRNYNPQSSVVRLGVIYLKENSQSLDEIEVTAEKSAMEFKLDKRVFNVGKDLNTTGMGALDVLSNVPSLNVNIEGQISLRGNTGVQILINGKPSVLSEEGSNALGTITADMIESIEVITNPSAKYEAEGTSGIINIILKKEEKKGFNGSVSVNTGIPDNHSVGVSLNRRTENFNFFTQFGLGYRSMPRYNESLNRNLNDGTEIYSEGTEYRNENFYNITLGTDYHINDWNVLTLSGSMAYEIEDQPSETDFRLTDANGSLLSEYRRTEETSATNPKYQYDLQYEKQFKNNEDHKLLISTLGRFFGKTQSSQFSNVPIGTSDVAPNQRTETSFFDRSFVYKLDYTNPITEAFSLEAGALYEQNDVGNDYQVLNYASSGYVIDSSLTNNFEYDQGVFGVYSTAAYEGKKWGLKLGLRYEHTLLNTLLTTTDEANKQEYSNWFPSIHSSYKISQRFSMQAGYSRRIFRPRLWDLNPFFNIRNNYNIRRGNPDLQPEFGDSYELTGIWLFEKLSLNTSLYHLYTTDVVDRVSFFANNVNTTMPVNVGSRNQTGLEINGKYNPLKWLVINGDFNYGYFSREGVFQDQDFSFEGDKWSTRITGKIKLPAGFDVELSGNYESAYKTVQGEQSGFAFGDIGLRKKLWDGKGVINLSVRDIFASRIFENRVYQSDFYAYSFSQRGRFLTLGFSYSFGKGEAMSYNGGRRH